jgi:Fe-S cluster biosynthesis and repair protein YggX
MTKLVNCIKLEQELEGLDSAPIPGDLGKKIFESVSKLAWQEWLKQQTMIINENRLNLADESARRYLRQQLEYYFFGSNT